MVLLSFKFYMNLFLFLFYCEQKRFIYQLFLHFSLSDCVFFFSHSSIQVLLDISFFGINLKERKKVVSLITVHMCMVLHCHCFVDGLS